MGYFPVRYDSRVVIYERKMFIRLATVKAARVGVRVKKVTCSWCQKQISESAQLLWNTELIKNYPHDLHHPNTELYFRLEYYAMLKFVYGSSFRRWVKYSMLNILIRYILEGSFDHVYRKDKLPHRQCWPCLLLPGPGDQVLLSGAYCPSDLGHGVRPGGNRPVATSAALHPHR